MSNTQFYFALGVPFFTLLIVYFTSVFSNRSAITDLRSEMNKGDDALRSEMRQGFADLRSSIGDLRSDLGARLDRIEKKQEALDSEIRIGHDHRIAVLEAQVLHHAS